MNRLLKCAMLVLIVTSSLYVQSMLWAQEEAPAADCDASSLAGTYGFGMSGVENNSQVAYAGILTFDGGGKILGIIRNGFPGEMSNVNGTYKANANCTGLAAITSPKPAQVQWTFFIALTTKTPTCTCCDRRHLQDLDAQRNREETIVTFLANNSACVEGSRNFCGSAVRSRLPIQGLLLALSGDFLLYRNVAVTTENPAQASLVSLP